MQLVLFLDSVIRRMREMKEPNGRRSLFPEAIDSTDCLALLI